MSRPLVRVALLGAAAIVIFVALLQYGFSGNVSGFRSEHLETYVYSPCFLLLVSGLAWYGARRLKLRLAFLTGAVLPWVLAGVTLGTGVLLRALEINPVRDLDGWIGWGIVAIAFFPAASVWYLSGRWWVRLTVFGTGLALLAGMVLYSWTARERWRLEYYAEHTSYSAFVLLEVPGFRMEGMDFIEYTSVSPIYATVAYLLEGQGDHRGVSLYVESDPGAGFNFDTGEELAAREDGLDLEQCRLSRLVKPGGQEMCMDFGGLVFLLEGATFHIFWKGSGSSEEALRAVAAKATVRRTPVQDLRHIPVDTEIGYLLRPSS